MCKARLAGFCRLWALMAILVVAGLGFLALAAKPVEEVTYPAYPELGTITELVADYDRQSFGWIPILVPSSDIQLVFRGVVFMAPNSELGRLCRKRVAPDMRDGIAYYQLVVRLDVADHTALVSALNTELLAEAARDANYDPYWYMPLNPLGDPARILMVYEFVSTDDATALAEQQAADAIAAQAASQRLMVPMSMSMQSYSNLCIAVIEPGAPNSNSVQLTIGYPAAMSNTPVAVVAASDLMAWDWSLLGTTNSGTGSSLTYICSTNGFRHFYACYNTLADTDGDDIPDGAEIYLTQTDPDVSNNTNSVSGTVSYHTYSDGQTGAIYVIAIPADTGGWSTNYSTTISEPGPYTISNMPSTLTTTYMIRAFRDSNGNGTWNSPEAHGSNSTVAISANWEYGGVDVVMEDVDSDGDGMGDWWEARHFEDLDESDAADYDEDKLSNLFEYHAGTDPTAGSSDNDNDGIADDWEVAYGLDPTDPLDADADPDCDGFTNLEEYSNGGSPSTDPTAVTSHPGKAYYVRNGEYNGGSDSDPGTYSAPYLTISHAVSQASADTTKDRVVILPGYDALQSTLIPYTGSANRNIQIDNVSLKIIGPHGPEETIIDCEGAPARGFYCTSSYVTLQGITVKNGNASLALVNGSKDGGAVYAPNAITLNVLNCHFSGCEANNGGAIYAATPTVVINDSVITNCEATSYGGGVYMDGATRSDELNASKITGCSAASGGGIYVDQLASLSIQGCEIRECEAATAGGDGGGLYVSDAYSVTIAESLLHANSASDLGGAIFMDAGDLSIADSLVTENTAEQHSAMHVEGGATMEWTTITGNTDTASANAELIFIDDPATGTTLIRNCLIAGNRSTNGILFFVKDQNSTSIESCTIAQNRGISGVFQHDQYGTFSLKNTIIWDNQGVPFYSFEPVSSRVTYSNVEGWTNSSPYEGCISVDPLFQEGSQRLSVFSPCIDQGTDVSWAGGSVDLDGLPRKSGTSIDMGCYETKIHYVSESSQTPMAPYTSWPTAATNIQDAIDSADGIGTVAVSNGVYASGTADRTGTPCRVAITSGVHVISVNGPSVTSIEGAGPRGVDAVRCAYVASNAVLSGFTLTDGATLTTVDQDGAGAFIEAGGLIANCIITNCYARNGGGLFGGRVEDTTVTDCTASDSGGGAQSSFLERCTLSENAASWGGGTSGGMNRSCLLVGNAASGYGGGCSGGYIENCTIVSNSAATLGVGTMDSTVQNSIVYGNSTSNWHGGSFSYSCTTPLPPGAGNIALDPAFDPVTGDYRLLPESPCVDTGTINAWMATALDLVSAPRVVGPAVDMGAREATARYWFSTVFDLSGSIGSAQLDAEQNGIARAIELSRNGSALSAISFDYEAELVASVMHSRSEADRDTIKQATLSVTNGGGTYIHAGLDLAQAELNLHKGDLISKDIALYTDAGFENIDDGYLDTVPVDIELHAVLPPEMNTRSEEFQSWAAQRRPGSYHAAPTTAGYATMHRRSPCVSLTSTLVSNSSTSFPVHIDDTFSAIDIRTSWTLGEAAPTMTLSMPDGTPITESNADQFSGVVWTSSVGSVVCSIASPASGEWSLAITTAVSQTLEACVYGQSPIGAELWLENSQYAATTNLMLRAITTPLATNAVVTITNIWEGGGSYDIELFDDGLHGEGVANDGIYAGVFTNAITPDRSWRATLLVQGETANGSHFRRYSEKSFYVVPARTQLDAVTNLVATTGTDAGEVDITWNGVTDATHYDLFHSTTGKPWDERLIYSDIVTSATHTNATVGVTNYYRVRCHTEDYLDSDFSAPEGISP